jgi:hypothetical protein
MSKEKVLTFEEVNAHIEKHMSAKDAHLLAANTAPDLCSIYLIARPILVMASQAFFLPQKWRQIIIAFIAAIDVICPQGNPPTNPPSNP